MKKITESVIEDFAIELIKDQGFAYLFGPDISPDGSHPERSSYADVILIDRLSHAINTFNPSIPADARK